MCSSCLGLSIGLDKVFNVIILLIYMNKRGLILEIIIIGILLVVGFFWFVDKWNSTIGEDCVAASCCHASECVWGNKAPSCDGTFCTMSCENGTMDCGAGHCEVVDGECEVVWDE